MSVKISGVEKRSPCAKKGIKAGDELISVNGNEINDVLDYRFYTVDEKLTVTYKNSHGKTKSCRLKHCDGADSLGLEFETYLMDKHISCKNHCIFCFIDQMPKGLRKSLYFKDDDSRLSFLFGNYITLTNLSDRDVERIIKMHISPINCSVHTMDPDLRVKMMRNPHAGESLKLLKRFSDAGIKINAQLVLCPGINDGDALDHSLQKLAELENVSSVAAVPVGLTKYRDGLFELSSYDRLSAGDVIDCIDRFNDRLLSQGKEKLAYPSDEFYLLSERPFPEYEYYGDFPQLDNGVGLCVLNEYEFDTEFSQVEADSKKRNVSIATGKAAFPLIDKLARRFCKKFTESNINVYCIENEFFGEKVTVAGLITGNDLISQLKAAGFVSDKLYIPSVMLKSEDEPVFLDDISTSQVESELNTEVVPTRCDGSSLFGIFYGALS